MLESRKESMLERAYICFTEVRKVWCETSTDADERWLHHYMLGKIAEKLKKDPVEYLNHYWEVTIFLQTLSIFTIFNLLKWYSCIKYILKLKKLYV